MKNFFYFKIYREIYKLVPSKIKYLQRFFYFLIGSFLDLFTISLIPLLINKVLNNNNENSFYNFLSLDNYDLNFLLLFFISIFIIKLVIYIIIYYDFINYSHNFKNIILLKIFKNILNSKNSIKDKKDEYLNLIRVVETFINSILIPSFNVAFEFVIILLIFIFLSFWNIAITFSIFFSFLIISGIYVIFLKKKMKLLGWLGINLNEEILKFLSYAIVGFREIILNKKQKSFNNAINKNLKNLKNVLVKYDVINVIPRLSFEFILIVIFSVLFFIKDFSLKVFILNSSVYLYAFLKITPSLIKIIGLTNAMNFGQYSNNIIKKELLKKNFLDNVDEEVIFEKCHLKNLSFKTKENFKINYPNFDINRYDKILITGQSGKGKSTLLDIICDFKKPSSGNIEFLSTLKKTINQKSLINYCPQEILILKENLRDNIFLNFDKKDKNNLNKNSELMNFEKNIFTSKNIINLSEGEKKRIGLIRVLNSNSQILIFDEPTSNLDKKNTKIFFDKVKKIKDKTILIVSHNNNFNHVFNKIIKL